MLGVVGCSEGRVDVPVGRMIRTATHRAVRVEAVVVAERQPPDPRIHLLEVFDRTDQLARILIDRLLQLACHDRERFFPADRHPARVDADALDRVGALEWLFEAVRVVMAQDRRVALRAQLAIVRRVARVTFDLVDDAVVGDMDARGARVQAHLAGRFDPPARLDGIVHRLCCSGHRCALQGR